MSLSIPEQLLQTSQYKINRYNNNEYYNTINQIIIKYVKDNNCFINTFNFSDNKIYPYTIYSSVPFTDANNLTNILYNVNPYTTLSTNLVDKEFSIRVNNELIVEIYLLFVYGNKKISNIFSNVDSGFMRLPDFIFLTIAYRRLYQPESFIDKNSVQLDYVNDIRVSTHNLQHNDILQIGGFNKNSIIFDYYKTFKWTNNF